MCAGAIRNATLVDATRGVAGSFHPRVFTRALFTRLVIVISVVVIAAAPPVFLITTVSIVSPLL